MTTRGIGLATFLVFATCARAAESPRAELRELDATISLATSPGAGPSELLRLYLLQALVRADKGDGLGSDRWRRLARVVWEESLASDPRFLVEIELTERDLRNRAKGER